MRKIVTWMVALVFALSMASVATAAARKAPKSHRLTGTVVAVDAAAGTFTVQGRRVSVSLKAGEKVALDRIAAGDRVLVTYSGDTASSVNEVPPKKNGKKVAGTAASAAPTGPAVPAERK